MLPSRKSGFTLIELLVVIAIIGLLSSVVFATVITSRSKAYYAKAISSQNELAHRLGADLVAYYNFDEESGATVLDGSGNSNKGTISNAMRVVEQDRSSISFNGVDSDVYITSPFPISTTNNEFTFSALIYLNSDSVVAKTIIGSEANGSDNYFTASNKKLCLTITEFADVNNQAPCTPPNSIKLNQWTHVSFSIKNSNYSISINGAPVSKGSVSYNIASWGGSFWHIGRRTAFSALVFDGKIDDVRLFDKADF